MKRNLILGELYHRTFLEKQFTDVEELKTKFYFGLTCSNKSEKFLFILYKDNVFELMDISPIKEEK